ncbi:unnamed protein product [Allacma fusca]|uniref:Dopey N-terminal domain-containing protein n=1 Tax=Allacma fusca TaxID=39272 RepID=A0A8J2LIM3_9HEXA|nr:unnamed protein product [Allacma fusca]
MLTEQELELYNSDGKFRSYTSGIEKALKNFEYSSEWPDLISALGKLSKVISSHSSKFKSIPKTLIISKRLAQCLHPSLPSGVHIKTIEVYDLIFKCLRGNVNHIFIYATGLFPLLQYAGITVRPLILKIYEDHFLPLGESLEMVLDGLLIGLLNGMEDGSDLYERCTALLSSIKGVVSPEKFYPKLWSSMVVNTTRLPAVNYMIMDMYVPSEPAEILPTLQECLNDSNILVQRSTLELLNNWDMKTWDTDVRIDILAGSMGTLLRRDVSLNRRFFSMIKDEDWIVVEATRKILSYHQDKFRIVMMLIDKPEVSSKIMDAILMDVIRALYHHKENDFMQMFITNLEPNYVVDYLANQEITEETCELISYVYKYVTNGDFSRLLLKLIEPVEFKLKLGISLLGHCQGQLEDYSLIKHKLFSMYSSIIEADPIEFNNSVGFQLNFDQLNFDREKTPIAEAINTNANATTVVITAASPVEEDELLTPKVEEHEATFDICQAKEESVSESDVILIVPETVVEANDNSDSETCQLEDEDQVDKGKESDSEPLTNYFSLNESFDCDSVVSCNYHFGLNSVPENRENLILDVEKALYETQDKEYRNGLDTSVIYRTDEKEEEGSAVEQSDEYLNGMAEVILNDLNAHLEKIAKEEFPDDKMMDEDDEILNFNSFTIEDQILLDSAASMSTLSNEDSSLDDRPASSRTLVRENTGNESSENIEIGVQPAPDYHTSACEEYHRKSFLYSSTDSARTDRLRSVLHKLLPKIVTTPIENGEPWLLSLLTSCYSQTNAVSKQQALNSFLEIIPFVPLKKLRKHTVMNQIIESLWQDKNYETLAKFLVHFPETESLIVIKLNRYEEILNFQEFILNNSSSSVDNCILKLIDNLECDNNLIIHSSYKCLNEIISKFSYIIIDPLIINMMDKSTRRHYTEVKSNSTPDLRLTNELNPTKYIHRSTGNLNTCDSQLNILVYNTVYDNRRIKFILDKLCKMFKFPEFIMKLCIVNISKSPRFKQIFNFNTSFYNEDVEEEDVLGNLEIQVTSCTILNELCTHLIPLTNTNSNHQSNSFSCYIDSVMKDTKLVKKVLGGLLSILNLNDAMDLSLTYRLLQFNYSHTYYTHLILVEYIQLVTTLIQLESRVLVKDVSLLPEGKKYIPNLPIMDQPMFKSILLKGLLNCSIHWENLLRKSLNYCNNIRIVQQVIQILCENLTSKTQTHESTSINLSTLTTILHDIVLETNHHDNSEIKPNASESSWYNPLTWLPTLNNNNNNNNNIVSAKDIGIKYQAKLNILAEFGIILKTIVHVWIHFPSLRPTIINLLNPIALHHMEEFLSATSDIETTDDLVEIVFQLNVIRLTNLTSSTIQIMTQGKSSANVINILTLYSKYIEKLSTNYDLPNTFLISLIKEGSNLTLPIGQNLVLMILNRIVCTNGLQSNWAKNEIKELQEVTQKLLESIAANTSLTDNKKKGGVIHQQDVIIISLHCLSDNLHGLLDIVWGSDDKDKLLPILSHMIYLLMGHLKGKTSPTFTPTTILLTNLTKYTHLRKAWKKEIFEYLIESSFFRMNLGDFRHWMIILDNIFSQDKNSFTELIARATVPTSNSLNIFTSKETEYENRASLLKRLAVVIYASDMDEYIKFITSIQERISESLKASPNVIPNIQLNVVLLFRVLLKKLSSNHLTSLWPIIIHEIGIVFAILEQYLLNPHSVVQYNIQKETGIIERSWSQLFNSIFKLIREASSIPVFRMYSWNFKMISLNNDLPAVTTHREY